MKSCHSPDPLIADSVRCMCRCFNTHAFCIRLSPRNRVTLMCAGNAWDRPLWGYARPPSSARCWTENHAKKKHGICNMDAQHKWIPLRGQTNNSFLQNSKSRAENINPWRTRLRFPVLCRPCVCAWHRIMNIRAGWIEKSRRKSNIVPVSLFEPLEQSTGERKQFTCLLDLLPANCAGWRHGL